MFARKLIKPSKIKIIPRSLTSLTCYSYFNQQPQKFNSQKNYYSSLSVGKSATPQQIKRAYYKLAKQYHPDVNKGYQQKFKQISQAYQVLSDQKIKKQYDSARLFNQRWSQMGYKAKKGTYNYSEYQNVYYTMSNQERQQFIKEGKLRLKRMKWGFFGLFLFWLFFFRTPHKGYRQETDGTLIPMTKQEFYQHIYNANMQTYNNMYGANAYQGQFNQPNNQPYTPGYGQPYGQPYRQPQPYGQAQQQYGQPYGNNFNQTVNPSTNSPSYGSQYPQNEYIKQNESQFNSSSYYPQQNFNQNYPASFQGQTNQTNQINSQYKIERAQPHQPYPNSPYAQRQMQSNLKPDYKMQKPDGLQD